nr:hypothetical protein [Enterococcus faecium]
MRGAYTMENIDDETLEYQIEKALEQAKTVEEYRKIIRVAVGRWLQNLKDGDIKLNSVSDLKVLIEADLMLKEIQK